jgi:hypothetical protein
MLRAIAIGVWISMFGPDPDRVAAARRPACERVPGARFALEGPVR